MNDPTTLETPLTDAEVFITHSGEAVVPADFARQLETELSAATSALAEKDAAYEACDTARKECRAAWLKVLDELRLCGPLQAHERSDNQIEPPWELVARMRSALATATVQLATAEERIKTCCEDWAEDHTAAEQAALKMGVPKEKVAGDSYGVPGIIELVEMMVAQHESQLTATAAGLRAAQQSLDEWANLTDAGLRLRCGEMTAQEIRTVRAVLSALRDTAQQVSTPAQGASEEDEAEKAHKESYALGYKDGWRDGRHPLNNP